MPSQLPTTRYFAIGYFTAAQLAEKHRQMLAQAAASPAAVPPVPSAIQAVHVTIYSVDTGTETVDMMVDSAVVTAVGAAAATVTAGGAAASGAAPAGSQFTIERFDPAVFPGNSPTPQQAFTDYLASAEGMLAFGQATAVQLFSINIAPTTPKPTTTTP